MFNHHLSPIYPLAIHQIDLPLPISSPQIYHQGTMKRHPAPSPGSSPEPTPAPCDRAAQLELRQAWGQRLASAASFGG